MEVWVIESLPSSQAAGAAPHLGSERWPRFLYVTLVLALIVNVAVNAAWVASALHGLKDLDSFLHSGAAYAKGLDPYEYYWWLRPKPISAEALNLNPPISIYLFEPLASLNRGLLGTAFLFGSIAMVAASVGMLMRAYPDKRHWLLFLLVAGMAGMWQMLWYLQIYAPLLLATTGAWLMLRRGNWLMGGVLIGVVIAFKPNYALIPLVMLAAGHYRPALAAVATAGLISLVPLVIDGPHIYWEWLHLTESFNGYGWTSNASLVSVGERLRLAPVGQVVAVLLAATVLFMARRWRPDALTTMALGIMCVILVGPVSWAGYTLLLLPYLFSMRWDGWTWASIGLLVTPFAPGRAIGSLGLGGLSFGGVGFSAFHAPGEVVSVLISGHVLTGLGAVIMPLVGAVYAWAVLLLLVRLAQRLASERDEDLPAFLLRRRVGSTPKREMAPVRAPLAPGKPERPGAVAVRVPSDS